MAANTGRERGSIPEVQCRANAEQMCSQFDHGGHVFREIRIVNRRLGQRPELISGGCGKQIVQIGENVGRFDVSCPNRFVELAG